MSAIRFYFNSIQLSKVSDHVMVQDICRTILSFTVFDLVKENLVRWKY